MTEIWNFSPSLDNQVQLCITAARKDENNKWVKRFGHIKFDRKSITTIETETLIDLCSSQGSVANNDKNSSEEGSIDIKKQTVLLHSKSEVRNMDEITELLETDFQSNFNIIVDECLKCPSLLSVLAKQLSLPTIEKICTQVYNKTDIDRVFIRSFFEVFLPAFIKREYNAYTLEIIVRGNKLYPLECRLLLKTLVKDHEMPTKVLQDYVLTLNENQCSEFVVELGDLDLSGEEFTNNVFTIYTAYKACTKSITIQKYVLSMVSQYATFCATDRNYGRLFLTYLQAQKCQKGDMDYGSLEKLLDVHRSPFRRPCLTLLREMEKPIDGNSTSEDDND